MVVWPNCAAVATDGTKFPELYWFWSSTKPSSVLPPNRLLPLPSGTVVCPDAMRTAGDAALSITVPRIGPPATTAPVLEVENDPVLTTSAEVWLAPWPLIARLACRYFGATKLFTAELAAPNGEFAPVIR